MLSTHPNYRKLGIGKSGLNQAERNYRSMFFSLPPHLLFLLATKLVEQAIETMKAEGAQEVRDFPVPPWAEKMEGCQADISTILY